MSLRRKARYDGQFLIMLRFGWFGRLLVVAVVYGGALVAAPRMSMGWLRPLAPVLGDPRYRPSDSLELWGRCSLALQRVALPLKFVRHFARVDQKMVRGQQNHDPHPHPGIVADVIPNQLP